MPGQQIICFRILSGLLLFALTTLNSLYSLAANQLNSHAPQVSLSVPGEWVKPQNFSVADFADLRSPSHYHLVDKQMNGTTGKAIYSRFVYSLTDSSAIESSANIHIRFNPVYESLNIHGIQVRRAGQVVNHLKRSDIEVINAEDRQGSNIYSGEVEAVVLLKDVRVGDVIDYSYTIVGSNPVFADKFSAGATLGWGVPVDQIHVSVLMPASRPLQYKVFGSDAAVSIDNIDDTHLYHLNLHNTPEIYEEDKLPAWFNPYPHIQFSEYQNWQEVASWADELFKVDTRPSSALAQYLDELKSMPLQQGIDAAINFTQNQVRYLGLELGENSHRPHSPAETFDHRQGDCKDKSLLLSVLLKSLGVEAHVALVSSVNRQYVADYLPTHAVFDHAIVVIRHNQQEYWIDPTMTHQGSSLLSKFQADYGQALLVNASTKTLISAQPKLNYLSSIAVDEKIIAPDYYSAVDWQIVTTMTGREADTLRYRIKSEGLSKLSKAYLNYYAKRYPKIESLAGLEVDDNLATNQIKVTEHYLVADFWHINTSQNAEFALLADFPAQYVQLPKSIIREQPLAIYPNIKIEHQISLQLPEHIDFSAEAEKKVFEDPYILFESQTSGDRRLLTVRNFYQAKGQFVPVSDISEHLRLLNNVSKRMSYYNSITNVSSDPGIDAMQTLLKNLNHRRLAQANTTGE